MGRGTDRCRGTGRARARARARGNDRGRDRLVGDGWGRGRGGTERGSRGLCHPDELDLGGRLRVRIWIWVPARVWI